VDVQPAPILVGAGRLDQQEDWLGKRKSLEDKLEFAPITRQAWRRALEANREYQNQIKAEIDDLQKRISAKQQTQ